MRERPLTHHTLEYLRRQPDFSATYKDRIENWKVLIKYGDITEKALLRVLRNLNTHKPLTPDDRRVANLCGIEVEKERLSYTQIHENATSVSESRVRTDELSKDPQNARSLVLDYYGKEKDVVALDDGHALSAKYPAHIKVVPLGKVRDAEGNRLPPIKRTDTGEECEEWHFDILNLKKCPIARHKRHAIMLTLTTARGTEEGFAYRKLSGEGSILVFRNVLDANGNILLYKGGVYNVDRITDIICTEIEKKHTERLSKEKTVWPGLNVDTISNYKREKKVQPFVGFRLIRFIRDPRLYNKMTELSESLGRHDTTGERIEYLDGLDPILPKGGGVLFG